MPGAVVFSKLSISTSAASASRAAFSMIFDTELTRFVSGLVARFLITSLITASASPSCDLMSSKRSTIALPSES